MASGTGTYLAAKFLNLMFNAGAAPGTASIDLRLFQSGGLNAAGTGTEVTGTGYALWQITCNTTNFATTSTASITNALTISFGAATGTWTLAHTLGIYEHGNNNLLFFGDLAADKTLSNGDVFQFTGTNLTITQG